MKSAIRVCRDHEEYRYTLREKCPVCNAETQNPAPPTFSPDDKYGKYRRKTRWTK